MGWAGGSSLLTRVWAEVRESIPDVEDRRTIHLANLMAIFADDDCDTLSEVVREEWPESEEAYEMFLARDDDPEPEGGD